MTPEAAELAADSIAAILSALPLFALDKETRRGFALYAGVRALQTSWRVAREAGWLQPIGVDPAMPGSKPIMTLAGNRAGTNSNWIASGHELQLDGTGSGSGELPIAIGSRHPESESEGTRSGSFSHGGISSGREQPPYRGQWLESAGETLLLAGATSMIMHAFITRPHALQGGLQRFMTQVQPIDR